MNKLQIAILLSILSISATDTVKINNTKKVIQLTDSLNCSYAGNAAYFKVIRENKKDTIK